MNFRLRMGGIAMVGGLALLTACATGENEAVRVIRADTTGSTPNRPPDSTTVTTGEPDTTVIETVVPKTVPETVPGIPEHGDPGSPPDRAGVLAAAAVWRVGGPQYWGPGDTHFLAIVDRLGTTDEYGMVALDESVRMTSAERAAIAAEFPGIDIEWVSSPDGVVDHLSAESQTPGDVLGLLTLSDPTFTGDIGFETSGIVCPGLCGVGGTSIVERQDDGSWAVTGQTGGGWIS